MNRPFSAQWLDEITGVSDQWLRRCNGQPESGLPINRHGLRLVLATSKNVAADPDGTITWTVDGRKFTAEPIHREVPA
jgi:hypothetical protein